MSPRKSSRAPQRRRDRLTIHESFDLTSGNQNHLSFGSEDERQAAWEVHGRSILAKWRHAGRRPWAWYVYEQQMTPPPKFDPRDPADFNHEALWLAENGHLADWEIDRLRQRRHDSDRPALAALSA